MYEQKPDTGALFKNDKRGNEKAPDYTGDYTTADGKKRRIAAWISKSKKGDTYMSLKFSDMQPKREPTPQEIERSEGPKQAGSYAPTDFSDDLIPF